MCPVGDGWELPPGSEPWTDFHWFQASGKRELDLVVLSEFPTWYTGHFSEKRMVPCPGRDCSYCAAGVGAQVRYCFAVADMVSRRVGLMELGRSNGLLLQDWSHRNGGVRGMVVNVKKHSSHCQSRTEVSYVEEPCPLWAVGIPAPDPSLALYLTWHKAGFEMPASFETEMAGFVRSRTTRWG